MRIARIVTISLLTFAVLLCLACTSGSYHRGKAAFDKGEWQVAADELQKAAQENPQKQVLWQKLGVAYYKTDQHLKAVDALKQAVMLDSSDGVSILYLGLSQEVLGRDEDALKTYSSYLAMNPSEELADKVRKRVRYLQDKTVREEVAKTISSEASIDPSAIRPNTVGVLGFNADSLDEKYRPLGRGLAEILSTDLSKVGGLTVVERLRLNTLKSELDLAKSDLVDPQTAPRLGKLLGAATVVSGTLDQPDPDEISAAAGVISTAKGIATYPDEEKMQIGKFFEMEKELLYGILGEMGYMVDENLKTKLDTLPTESMLAFLAYSRGLEYEDQGMYRLAEAEYQAAVREDPNFNAAKQSLDGIAGLSDYTGNEPPASDVESVIEGSVVGGTEVERTGYGLRITRSVLGFQADEVVPEEGDNPQTFPPVKARVTVTGSFDPEQ